MEVIGEKMQMHFPNAYNKALKTGFSPRALLFTAPGYVVQIMGSKWEGEDVIEYYNGMAHINVYALGLLKPYGNDMGSIVNGYYINYAHQWFITCVNNGDFREVGITYTVMQSLVGLNMSPLSIYLIGDCDGLKDDINMAITFSSDVVTTRYLLTVMGWLEWLGDVGRLGSVVDECMLPWGGFVNIQIDNSAAVVKMKYGTVYMGGSKILSSSIEGIAEPQGEMGDAITFPGDAMFGEPSSYKTMEPPVVMVVLKDGMPAV